MPCSDSRVVPTPFTGARPGDLLELRTAGDIAPPYQGHAACGVAGSLELAVRAQQVPDIVVCGHSHCGAVQGLLREQNVQTMPPVRRWLSEAGHRTRSDERRQTQGLGEDPVAATRRHVLAQHDHLRDVPSRTERTP
ncbi:carbonic anhydrase [Streptomyces sp. NPDC094038]|uniref:carbonic anhydrase n=1 Tax=Streptomyces sp. NPDC094038 TaxID=3366055 RepID=UPI00380F0614